MATPPSDPPPILRPDGTLYAPRYDDVYFQADGLAEARHVFVAGNDLEPRLAGAASFVIGETGFGTGLNFLAAWDRFRSTAPAGARLVFVSIEAAPLDRATLRAALAGFAPIASLADALVDAWPDAPGEFVRLAFESGRVVLCVLCGDAAAMLARYAFTADAWFLDGFAPARNPAIWSDDVLRAVAAHTVPGGTLATFTVAGAVRRGLERAGFALARRPGHGRKREMLTGAQRGAAWRPQAAHPSRIAVVGAGLAGAGAAHAFATRGIAVDVFDPRGVAQGASGHGLAVLQPRLGDEPDARFVAAAFRFTRAWFDRCDDGTLFHGCGVLQPAQDAGEADRLRRRLERGAHAPDDAAWLDAAACARQAGAPVGSHGGVFLLRAGVVRSAAFCARLLDVPGITLHRRDGTDAAAPRVLAHALAARALVPELVMSAGRGQVTMLAADAEIPPQCVVSRGGYLTPAIGGVRAAGATFARDDEDLTPRAADDATNRQHFAAWFADALAAEAVGTHVGIRALTTDRLPFVGRLGSSDTWVSLAHGARGLATAPFAGELVAAMACREPAPLASELLARIAPERRRGRGAALNAS